MSKMIPKMISLNFAGLLQHSTRFFMTSPSRHATFISTRWLEDDILQTLNDVFGQNLAILREFGPKYDRACNLDGIIYHFINFRKCLNAGIGQF